jgi:hypothetical protein
MLYAEEGRHVYGGSSSPDGKYVLFTLSVEDLGKVDNSKTTMAVIRRDDAPMLGRGSGSLQKSYPDAKQGQPINLGPGWEPHWTYTDVTIR